MAAPLRRLGQKRLTVSHAGHRLLHGDRDISLLHVTPPSPKAIELIA
jgi:hypothetical protein